MGAKARPDNFYNVFGLLSEWEGVTKTEKGCLCGHRHFFTLSVFLGTALAVEEHEPDGSDEHQERANCHEHAEQTTRIATVVFVPEHERSNEADDKKRASNKQTILHDDLQVEFSNGL